MEKYSNPGRVEFEATILRGIDVPNSSAFVDYPFSVWEHFGTRGRVPVNAIFDGIPYRGSLVKMGPGNHCILIQKEIRTKLGKESGDSVRVTIELDDAPRTVLLPDYLATAIAANSAARAFWETLAYSHRKEYVRWVEDAKRPETRSTRVAKTVEMLANGMKPPT